MAVTAAQVAEAVKVFLADDTQNWSQAFTTTRVYYPRVAKEDLQGAGIQVTVRPLPEAASQTVDRSGTTRDTYRMEVETRKHLESDVTSETGNAEVDALLALVAQQVEKLKAPPQLSGLESVALLNPEQPLLWNDDRLREDNIFQAVLSLPFVIIQ